MKIQPQKPIMILRDGDDEGEPIPVWEFIFKFGVIEKEVEPSQDGLVALGLSLLNNVHPIPAGGIELTNLLHQPRFSRISTRLQAPLLKFLLNSAYNSVVHNRVYLVRKIERLSL